MTKLIVRILRTRLEKRNANIERRFRVLFKALPTMEEAEVEENWLRKNFTERTLSMKLSDTRYALPALFTYWSAYFTL
jgi:hypothetical protein